MNAWTVGLITAAWLGACGSRTELASDGRETSARGVVSGQGGESSLGSRTSGGAPSLGGAHDGGESSSHITLSSNASGGASGNATSLGAKQKWLMAYLQARSNSEITAGGAGGVAATQGGSDGVSLSKVALVAIGSDNRVGTYPLPPYGSAGENAEDAPRFSPKGTKICYTTVGETSSRVWVVSLGESSYSVQETPLPLEAAPGHYYCDEWFSETVFSVRSLNTAAPADEPTGSYAEPAPVFLRTDPDKPTLARSLDFGLKSPNGSMAVTMTPTVPDESSYLLKVWEVDSDGLPSRLLFSQDGTNGYAWSEDGTRLAILSGQDTYSARPARWTPTAFIDVHSFSDPLSPTLVDRAGPLTYADSFALSPNGSFLSYCDSAADPPNWCSIRSIDTATQVAIDNQSGTWLGNHRQLFPGSPLQIANITDSAIAQSTVSLEVLSDQYGPVDQVTYIFPLSDSSLVVQRGANKNGTLQLLTLNDVGATTSELLKRAGGAARIVTSVEFRSGSKRTTWLANGLGVSWATTNPGYSPWNTTGSGSLPATCSSMLAPTDLSYFFLEFEGGILRRSVALQETFGSEYDYNAVPLVLGGGGLLARRNSTREYVWIYLDRDTPGPAVTIPLGQLSPQATFYAPDNCPGQ
jgi:hypothetical protein